ncbi:UvrD-helicase domain-containing protein [Paraburkholderia phenazinium]|uniref:UvrD-helicase domain-containing protein n=1 Tax=Paraburkholderia phenazinium TaxID=60549 RepID=UPI00158C9043|nr:UvrD-helicase domain-containing protein [Paraburkholderia phenazinium]
MNLTDEQQRVVDSTARVLAVKAFAGAGKTSTLKAHALAHATKRILYLAFNASIRAEASASFPSNVVCLTTHQLAKRAIGAKYKGEKLGEPKVDHITGAFGVDDDTAIAALAALQNFIYSTDENLDRSHGEGEPMTSELLELAQQIWASMRDPFNLALPMSHDGYLKLYQLSRPDLSKHYDIVLFDEAQDANPVTVDIVLSQRCKVVLVGDPHQSIYRFRRAVNAMEAMQVDETLYLTQSFRFGEETADLANQLLQRLKGETRTVKGQGATAPTVDTSQPYVIIARKNATVFEHAARLERKKLHVIGDIRTYLKRLRELYLLTPDLGDCHERISHAVSKGDMEVAALYGVLQTYGERTPSLCDRIEFGCVDRAELADVILTTVHRSKGMEFDQVILADDFAQLVDENEFVLDMRSPEAIEEVNLFYVAITRAAKALQINDQLRSFLHSISGTSPDDVPAALQYVPPGQDADTQSAATPSLPKLADVPAAPSEQQLAQIVEEIRGLREDVRVALTELRATAHSIDVEQLSAAISARVLTDLRAALPVPAVVGNAPDDSAGDSRRAASGTVEATDDLPIRLRRTILETGALQVGVLAHHLQISETVVTQEIIHLIRAGQLSARLFMASPEVSRRLAA